MSGSDAGFPHHSFLKRGGLYDSIVAAKFARGTQTFPMNPNSQALKLNQGNDEAPVFIIYCDEFESQYLSAIAKWFDGRTTIYGLPSPPSPDCGIRTVEGAAARMIAMIRGIQPREPYRLLGWSLGGILAYEIAAQLVGADEEVAFLGLLHVHYCGSTPSSRASVDVRTNDRLLATLRQRIVYSREHWRTTDSRFETDGSDAALMRESAKWREDAILGEYLNGLTDGETCRRVKQLSACARPFVPYHAPALPMRVNLFLARGADRQDAFLGWNQVISAGQIDVTEMPCDQYSLLAHEHIDPLCTRIEAKLSAAAKSRPGCKHPHNPILPIRSAKPYKPVLICVPGAGTGITTFVELAEHLGEELSVYGMQPRGLDNDGGPHTTVQAAAASYVGALAGITTKGNVNLLGHSYGGWVAFEMALQLQAKGIAVQSVIILDSEAPDHEQLPPPEYDDDSVSLEWLRTLEYILERPIGLDETDIANKTQNEQIRMIHGIMTRNKLMPRNSCSGDLVGPLRTFATALRSRYKPARPYLGPVSIFLAEMPYPACHGSAQKKRNANIAQQWRLWAPNLVAGEAPGNHVTMLQKRNAQSLSGLVLKAFANEPVPMPVTRGVGF